MTPKHKDKPLEGKIILITGGTGSFGKAFVKRVLATENPKTVRIISRDELKQHEFQQELNDPRANFFIGDVRDKDRLHRALHGVQVLVHAAALKQVPLCEYNPFEAIKTNTVGAMNVIDAAIDAGVEKVVALSTDKAVNPVNLYGATKLCAERLFIQGNAYSGGGNPRFACVRYGNVVGSRGSVVPIFLKQRRTGTLTVTHPAMTRFWITLEQGVELVLNAIAMMHGGEIFVPKLPSMKITDLAKIIAPDADVKITGIRPGEKIHEVLLTEEEVRHTVEVGNMYIVKPVFNFWNESNWSEGKPLPDDFRYSSSENSWWLRSEELKRMVQPIEDELEHTRQTESRSRERATA